MSSTGDRLQDPRDRQARAARILDVTAELLLRHGYRRVTVDDIARHADIGKGTVYLHWKTRDDLFKAVFEREVLRAARGPDLRPRLPQSGLDLSPGRRLRHPSP